MAIRFRTKPAFIISIIDSLPVLKIMAFGGVATGNIKAMEAARVTGIINSRGLTWISVAKPEIIGSIISVVAVLDVNSVSPLIIAVTTPINPRFDRDFASASWLPM